MKKIGIINASISTVIAHLEYTDMLTIADAGLPVPATRSTRLFGNPRSSAD